MILFYDENADAEWELSLTPHRDCVELEAVENLDGARTQEGRFFLSAEECRELSAKLLEYADGLDNAEEIAAWRAEA